jgi:asparagine synthase (glutamine-hydrolysing)
VHAIVNGELYDAAISRDRLRKDGGYTFKGSSDCEIVVALYQIYGLSFLRHLRGEFALCLYDSRTKIFVAARDRYGIKPLFLTETGGHLLVAAEMKAFKPFDWRPEWDVKSNLDRGWNHDQRTLLAGVKKVTMVKPGFGTVKAANSSMQVRPGSYFTCDVSGHINHASYWDLNYPDKVGFFSLKLHICCSADLSHSMLSTTDRRMSSLSVFVRASLKLCEFVLRRMFPSACS